MGNSKSKTILKSRKDFLRTYRSRISASAGRCLKARVAKNETEHLRIGWTIPSYVGTAVVRNRLKRWIREYIRHLPDKDLQHPYDVNLVFERKKLEFYTQLTHEGFDVILAEVFKRISTLAR